MIIIPARMASSRFPNKIIADINGLPMVIATAKRVESLDKVVIATDTQDIVDLANKHAIQAVLTSSHHQSGTDRINEASRKLHVRDDEIIVNVQADEPFIEPNVVKSVIDRMNEAQNKNEDIMITSCYKLIDKSFANDPNHVKVITDINGKMQFTFQEARYLMTEKIIWSILDIWAYMLLQKNLLKSFVTLALPHLKT